MSGFEALDAEKRFTDMLTDATLVTLFSPNPVGIYGRLAPREPASVYVVYNMTGAEDVNTVGAIRAFNKPNFYVEAVGREVGFDVLRPIMERIDALLTNGPVQVNNTYVGRFVRTNIVVRSDSLDMIRWHYIGATYDTIAFTV